MLRGRNQQQLDGLSAAVLMYVLHRHAALLPVRVSDINSKVLKDTAARGASRVVLKDVARRLRVIFGLRLVEAGKTPSASAKAAPAAGSQRAAGAAAPPAEPAGRGRKRGRSAQSNPRGAANASTAAADSYIVTSDQSTNARQQQQIELASDGTDATTPKRMLSSWRAHSALLFSTLALCAFTYKDGIIAEERLFSLLAGLFGLGSARELRQSTAEHMLFGDVPHLITHTWVEQQYLERVALLSDEVGDFSMYGAPHQGGDQQQQQHPHYRVGVRGRLEVGFERLYKFMVEDVMDSDTSDAGVKEMQRRDAAEQAAVNSQERKSAAEEKQPAGDELDGFAFTQPANRRSSATITLPHDQNVQRLSPYHQAALRYLLAHSVAPESAVLAFYKQCNPPSPRNPSLDELHTAINNAIEWAALRVERVPSEYGDERVWMIVSRSDADTALVFSAFSSEEVTLFRAWLQELVNDENEQGAAAMTVQDMETVAARLEGLGKDRARRLAEGSRQLAERLTAHGWLHKQRKIEPQLYSIGMRSFIELLKPRALAAAAAASSVSLSSASASSSSASVAGGLTLRLHECGRCRFDVYYGLYCGSQQDEHASCRLKYHYHCVQRVKQAGQTMRCRAGHTWKPRIRQRHEPADSSDEQDSSSSVVVDEAAGSGRGGGGSSSAGRASRRSQRSSQQQQQRGEEEQLDTDERPAAAAAAAANADVERADDEEDTRSRASTRRRLRRG